MSAIRALFAALCALALTACPQSPSLERDAKGEAKTEAIVEFQRVRIERIAVFGDDIAYDKKRGVYLVTDRITGQTFIGVSGIGIAEQGAHTEVSTTGKNVTTETVEDER